MVPLVGLQGELLERLELVLLQLDDLPGEHGLGGGGGVDAGRLDRDHIVPAYQCTPQRIVEEEEDREGQHGNQHVNNIIRVTSLP